MPAENPGAAALAAELRVVLGQLTRRLREQAQREDLTWSQKQVLLRLERDGAQTASGLARAEGVRPQSMSATLATLEKAGLVSGIADPLDGRQTLVLLTDHCRRMVRASRTAKENWLFQSIRKKFSPAEQAELASSLVLLQRLLEP